MSIREIAEGEQIQGVNEEIIYTLTVHSTWGVPTTPTVIVYSINESTEVLTDVTSVVMPSGAPSVALQVITLPKLKSLTAGVFYKIVISFTAGGDLKSAYAYLRCEA